MPKSIVTRDANWESAMASECNLESLKRTDEFIQYINHSDQELREFLYDSILRYNSKYEFENITTVCLEYQKILNGDQANSEIMQEEIRWAQGEYCFSLNEIGDAAEVLVFDEVITKERLLKAVNHILEAYACNTDDEKIYNEEIDKMISKLRSFKNTDGE